jgi:hypothetical protein
MEGTWTGSMDEKGKGRQNHTALLPGQGMRDHLFFFPGLVSKINFWGSFGRSDRKQEEGGNFSRHIVWLGKELRLR